MKKGSVLCAILLYLVSLVGCVGSKEVAQRGSHFEASDIHFGFASWDSIVNVRDLIHNRSMNVERVVLAYDTAGRVDWSRSIKEIIHLVDSDTLQDSSRATQSHIDSAYQVFTDSIIQESTYTKKVQYKAKLMDRVDASLMLAMIIGLLLLVYRLKDN